MQCVNNVKRIEEICEELMELIDSSRARCESDDCELVYCVVHDAVIKMRRAVAQWRPETPVEANPKLPKSQKRDGRIVN